MPCPARRCAALCRAVLCAVLYTIVKNILFRTYEASYEVSYQVPVHQVCTYQITKAFHGSGGFQNDVGQVESGRFIVFKNLTGGVGSGWVGSGRIGSDRVGSGRVESIRVGSGPVGSGRVGSGRVGSGQEVSKSRGSGRVGSRCFEISRVGSGHDPRDTGHSRVKPPLPAGYFCLTRGSNPRIWLADSPFIFKLTAACRRALPCHAGAPRAGPADPTCGSENGTAIKLAASCTKASLVPILRSYVIIAPRKIIPASNFSYQAQSIYYAKSGEAVGIVQVYCHPSKSTNTSQATQPCCIAGCNSK